MAFRAGADGAAAILDVGSVVLLEGVYDAEESAGEILGVVCRTGGGNRRFYVRVLAVQDDYMRWHLMESGIFSSTVPYRLASNTDADEEDSYNGEVQELAISWRTVVAAGTADRTSLESVEWLPKKEAERIGKDTAFCREMMVAAVCLRAECPPGQCPLPGTFTLLFFRGVSGRFGLLGSVFVVVF